ncbi:MAG TPA: zinc ribbon domain-containing protein [Thermoanaerobaculia bacterium]|nr:zinc ribbon domain-containing protein [Thermoanaerobaculia bacterium]
MKSSGVCPKCHSNEIRVMRRRMWATMIPLNFTVFAAAYTSWFICTSCGFVETWVESKQDLDKIREKLGGR